MKPFALAFALSLAVIGSAQDKFPPLPLLPIETGLLPAEAKSWPIQVQTRKAVARILELTGLATTPDGEISVARDDAMLQTVYGLRSATDHWLHFLPGGKMRMLGPEGQALEKELHKVWDVIPRLLAANSTRYFPDIPEHHKAYETLSMLQHHDLLDLPWPRNVVFTRHFFAVAAREACAQLPDLVRDGGALSDQPWGSLGEALNGLALLIDEFQVELRILGCDPAQMRLDVHLAFRGGFNDVPSTHWAAPAIEALHRKGLLKGYPGKTFANPKSSR